MKLEDIKPGGRVEGVIPGAPVEVLSVGWIGKQAVNIFYRGADGNVGETTKYREDEAGLVSQAAGRRWSFDADGALLRLVTEANRIKLAHLFDPYLAIHTSQIDPLPHQISAVYGDMLSRQPLRFLLADDPGAGKTIMAGLLIKELIARSDLERCLVVAPGSLVEQWQDELGNKFALDFDILSRDMLETSRSGNAFNDRNRLIARLDVLARNEDLKKQLAEAKEWDLIICDEAHRMSASYFGGEVKTTKRHKLGQQLGGLCRHFLLMTATPHNGKEEEFQLFMALLDGDRFEGRFRDGVHYADSADLMRRLTKEELLTFEGCPLFPERRAYTVKYQLSDQEARLYAAVTNYVREEMNRVSRFVEDGRKKNNVGFALQILQRRLASSPAAIYHSLKRRHARLEEQLAEARLVQQGVKAERTSPKIDQDLLDNLDEYDQDEVDAMTELASASASSAETIEQLELEVATLQSLVELAWQVLCAGQDTKWQQLDNILDDALMIDAEGNRRKLIIFTEPKDTLFYLADKVRARLGCPRAVEVIHGGVTREDRRKVVERFMQDRDLLVLVANDAAGEGVNLQRGHLMVNYDLPWNPNKIEQRFGRIHRIGQMEVCHLWNLVAADTREGEVYARLLDKLEAAREALGGRVYDVLGNLFEGTALRDLLLEAIQYGEQDHVRAKLFQAVDGAVDQRHLEQLLQQRQLTNDSLPAAEVHELRLKMERAQTQRLQPYHVQSFFIQAFKQLGGQVKEREAGRLEITHVPLIIRERDRGIGTGAVVQKKYERICFDKSKVNAQPVAAFLCPGHPLLEAVISLIREQYGHLMQQGAVLVDDEDPGCDMRALFLLEHRVQDGRTRATGQPHTISEHLQFVSVDQSGKATNAGPAPHLDLRPAAPEELAELRPLLDADWLRRDLEETVTTFATLDLAQSHVAEVKERRLPQIDKVEQEVRTRLKREISYWDNRALELKEEERSGKKTRLSWKNAEQKAEELAERLKRRTHLLGLERFISAQPPRLRGGLLVIPGGLLQPEQEGDLPPGFAEDPLARRTIELKAMEAVMAAERALGNDPKDISDQKLGYDIASYDPGTDQQRFIEVKGRIEGADTIMITRQEIITSLNEDDKFILALVQIRGDCALEPRYVRGNLDTREPRFDQSAIQFKIKDLLERSEAPA